MAKINIVLVEPEIPQNTGNIARTCAVTGAALHIVRPMGFDPTDKRLKHAGLDYWQYLSITYYDSLSDFLEKTHGPYYFFTTKAQNRHVDTCYRDGAYLVFGKESAGLPEKLLFDHPDDCVRIPMMDDRRSLNLAKSVAVGLYEALRQLDFPELSCSGQLRDFDWAEAKQQHPQSEFL